VNKVGMSDLPCHTIGVFNATFLEPEMFGTMIQ